MEFINAVEILETDLEKHLGMKKRHTTGSGLILMNILKEFIENINQNKSSNSEYAKCSEEIFNKFLYNHDLSYKNKIESIIKKHFA